MVKLRAQVPLGKAFLRPAIIKYINGRKREHLFSLQLWSTGQKDFCVKTIMLYMAALTFGYLKLSALASESSYIRHNAMRLSSSNYLVIRLNLIQRLN